MTQFVAYYRVSKEPRRDQARHVASYGIEAQRARVAGHVASVKGGTLAAEFTEVESGKCVTRPQLDLAIAKAAALKATLIVAKLDRLARNTRYLLKIVDSGISITFCDLPQIPDGAFGRFIITQMAAVAEFERGMISERTKAALAVARAGGKRLGTHGRVLGRARRKEADERARSLRDLVISRGADLRAMTAKQAAAYLNTAQISTYTGVPWKQTTTQRLLDRIRHLS